ncbi:mandelate racemase/muconate lactonizing enzyme family protein [Loktanella sp. F6476L]|uniref:mandelate racemase/muconate lactonizing enzyme family protein n=1 Tax=Loktanella sp. F6476L TaxID=2926405 RepID=UPI001FF59DB4|nr:mandelate racemase/muconate lactonizing enzyme family protein [Loktanella sp. F6476L]MCK0122208.1 mandelate racemase/muconate lactonizing enzyme family protein [Loktanella sp. F6476L]
MTLSSAAPNPATISRLTSRPRITAIIPYAVWVGGRNQLIVKVETDSGIFGWGESGLSGREKAVIGALEHFAEILKGEDAFDIGALWQRLYRSQYFEGGRVLQAAISAIDIALHDIKGKALDVPVYQLLGGQHRNKVPTFASTASTQFDTTIEQAKSLASQGWDCIRVFPDLSDFQVFDPRAHIGRTAAMCREVRQELGEGMAIGIDWHHRLSVAEAASFCQRMPSGTLDFIEEPIRDETPEAYEALRRMTDIPFAIGEEFSSKWDFRPYIERDIHQFNRVDVCNVGGLTEAVKVAAMSEAHYVDLMPHNPLGPICTAASVHLAVAVPNFAWLEVRVGSDGVYVVDDARDLFPTQHERNGIHFDLPQAAGLGVDVNEDHAKELSFKFWNAPMLRRPDGSLTNW